MGDNSIEIEAGPVPQIKYECKLLITSDEFYDESF